MDKATKNGMELRIIYWFNLVYKGWAFQKAEMSIFGSPDKKDCRDDVLRYLCDRFRV